MKKTFLVVIMLFFQITFFILLESCASDTAGAHHYNFNTTDESGMPYPDVSFAVLSDIHTFDPSIHSPKSEFLQKRLHGSKLFSDSIPLLDFAIDNILASGVSFVIVPGDLTKDGELTNHQITAEKFKRLTDAGIAVFVTPGNHDINNAKAVRFTENGSKQIPGVSADKFAQVYKNFGFSSVISRDANSLSYAAEPVEGLWLLSLDSCRHSESKNRSSPYASGRFKGKTINWINKVLSDAHKNKKAVIVMMHHGVVEHFRGQGKSAPSYIIADFNNVGRLFASWNVRVVFSGHSHTQDIARADFGGKYIYDIQSGSTVTPPFCPMRFVELKDNVMHIRTVFLAENIYPDTDFAQEIYNLHRAAIKAPLISKMRSQSIKRAEYELISNAIADAVIAHNNGDENPANRVRINVSALSAKARSFYKKYSEKLDIYWTDIPPGDNNISLNLD